MAQTRDTAGQWADASPRGLRASAKVAEQYLHKGSKVYLEGSLQTRKWQDQSGQDRYSTEVVLQGFNSVLTMLDRAGDRAGGDVGSDEDDFGVSPSTRERKPAMAGTRARGLGQRDLVLTHEHEATT